MSETDQDGITTLTVQLLGAYLANNTVASEDLAGLIQSTRNALAGEPAKEELAAPVFTPAVTVRKSLASRDRIISMIDGKPYKTLKRHLTTHGLTPAEYRERYNLAKDYPLVAPAYSEQRRQTAARIGLGRKPKVAAPAEKAAAPKAARKTAVRKPKTAASAPLSAAPAAPASAADIVIPAKVAKTAAPSKKPRAPKALKAPSADKGSAAPKTRKPRAAKADKPAVTDAAASKDSGAAKPAGKLRARFAKSDPVES
ncbi:MAG TPA: MucR family transcriptional regulator [Sphingobium sp.]